jgi:prolyl-tRNA synthetase
MRMSHSFTKTRRDAPKDETAKNAQLLVRAGFIYKELAGVYSFLPLGLMVLRNIEQIVREEMNGIGGQELQMTGLQDKMIWETTGRWSDEVVDVWFKTKLHNETELGLAPTHEEPMTRIAASYISSYKDLPFSTYQFQWKLRNELRAKSGIMRGREFRMKDLYSFSANQEQHDTFYEVVRQAYVRIYDRLGIGADTYYTYASGGMFSKYSHEFQTVLDVGEDTIFIDDASKIAINEEVLNDEVLGELNMKRDSLRRVKAAEVGNIFPLGTKYSEVLGAKFTTEAGTEATVIMGSYGVGVSRLIGVLAEYFSDERGLVWPASVAPAEVHLIRLGNDDAATITAADKIYHNLIASGHSVIYDDRNESAGNKFGDADLMGMPLRVTVSKKTLLLGSVEFKARTESEARMVKLEDILAAL